jgi:DNA primase catalytic subunit
VDSLVQTHLADYYRAAPLQLGDIPNREIMFEYDDGRSPSVARHWSAKTMDELRSAIVGRPPASITHSAARYLDPGRQPIQAKRLGLINCDLTLDIDFKPGPRNGQPKGDGFPDVQAALVESKAHARRGLRILDTDFGIPAEDAFLVFSGSKGYNVRLSKAQWANLDRDARENLLRYLSLAPGHNPWPDGLPADSPPGGPLRRLYSTVRVLEAAVASGKAPAWFAASLRRLDDGTFLDGPAKVLADIESRGLAWALKDSKEMAALVMEACRLQALVQLDAGVMTNLVGLVRLVGSVNPKSGLRCTAIPPGGLDAFEPLVHGNPWSWDKMVRVKGLQPYRHESSKGAWELSPGHEATLPQAVALPAVFAKAAALA